MNSFIESLKSPVWWVSVVVVGVLTSVLAAFLKDGFDWARGLLARLLTGQFASDREITCFWITEYDYPRGGIIEKDNPRMRLWRLGKFIVGRGRSTIDESNYRIQGKLSDEGLLTGYWYERTKQGRHYYGAFQLFLKPTNDEFIGKWIGFSGENVVKSGDWRWKKEPNQSLEPPPMAVTPPAKQEPRRP
jgi:hypothetical protein